MCLTAAITSPQHASPWQPSCHTLALSLFALSKQPAPPLPVAWPRPTANCSSQPRWHGLCSPSTRRARAAAVASSQHQQWQLCFRSLSRSLLPFLVEAWQPTAFAERNSVLPPSPPSVLSSMAPAHSSAVPQSVASGIRCHATRSSLACHIRHPHPPAPPHRRYSSFPSPAYMVEDATPATRSSLFRASLSLFLPLAPRSPVSLPTSVDTD